MDDKVKKDFIQLFNQGFEEIVLPNIERLDKKIRSIKEALKVVDTRLEVVETRLNVVERKLDTVIDNQVDFKNILKNHDIKIQRLEDQQIAA